MRQSGEIRWYRLSQCARANDDGQRHGFRTPLAKKTNQQINELPGVELIVFGASSATNIRGTKALVDRYLGAPA